jgi:peptide subunit release factor 1 (eRF1)
MNIPAMFSMGSQRRAVFQHLATKLLKNYDYSVQNKTRKDILPEQQKKKKKIALGP